MKVQSNKSDLLLELLLSAFAVGIVAVGLSALADLNDGRVDRMVQSIVMPQTSNATTNGGE